jgi:hypothetical protein
MPSGARPRRPPESRHSRVVLLWCQAAQLVFAMKVAISCSAAARCHSEPPTLQAWACRRISRRHSFGGVICLILLSCKVAGSADPWMSEPRNKDDRLESLSHFRMADSEGQPAYEAAEKGLPHPA